MQDIFSHMSDSILAHRIMAELYIQQENFEDAIKAAESGLELAKRSESSTGKAMPK
jgi:superkiller protein 3